MKSLITSRLAAFAATLATGLVAWLASQDIITPDQVAQSTGEATTLLQALFAAAAAFVGWLLVLLFRKFAGGNSGGGNGTGGSGGKFPSIILTAAVLSMAGLGLPSCSALSSAITGAPIPATAVQRAGHDNATPVLIASADLAQAEAAAEAAGKAGTPPPVHGLYDAGRAATVVREVFTDSSK